MAEGGSPKRMFKILTIPFDRIKKGFDDESLNRFLINKQIKSYRAEFFQDGEEKFWTVFVEYEEILEKTSERTLQGLNEPQKLLLERLKAWRKERAAKDGVPVFIIATNSEFLEIVRKAPGSYEALKGVKGFGKGKIAKYGEDIIGLVNAFYEKSER
jgi:superfamily II DNA helicase RecQ